jgi:hypothetical protein
MGMPGGDGQLGGSAAIADLAALAVHEAVARTEAAGGLAGAKFGQPLAGGGIGHAADYTGRQNEKLKMKN